MNAERRNVSMSLGEKLLQLRKQKGLSQEQLGEQIEVTRQTISNWELGDTSPNPEQLKRLSRLFQVSIDELLGNEVEEVLMKKISNTEKLAGMTIKSLKIIGRIVLIYLVFLTIMMIALIVYASTKKQQTTIKSKSTMICELEDTKYQLELETPNDFKCNNCTSAMKEELEKQIDFDQQEESLRRMETYFITKGGNCDVLNEN